MLHTPFHPSLHTPQSLSIYDGDDDGDGDGDGDGDSDETDQAPAGWTLVPLSSQ